MNIETNELDKEASQWRNHFNNVDLGVEPKSDDSKVVAEAEKQEPQKEVKEQVKEVDAEEKETKSVEPEEVKGENKDEIKKPELFDDKEKKKIKSEKESQRLEKTWQNVESRKAELAQREQEFEKSKQTFIQQAREQARKEFLAKRPDIFTLQPEHYFDQAKQLEAKASKAEEDGDYKEAAEFRKLAHEHQKDGLKLENDLKSWRDEEARREHEQSSYNQKVATYKQNQFKELVEQHPELEKGDSPLRLAIDKIYSDRNAAKLLQADPNEYHFAVNIASLMIKAESATALEQKVKSLETELQKINKKVSPSLSSDTGMPKKKSVGDMDLDDAGQYFRRLAAQADGVA